MALRVYSRSTSGACVGTVNSCSGHTLGAHMFGACRSLDDSAPFSSTQALIDPLVAWILPLWEDAASNLGLPRTLDGIARLHRAVAVMTDTRVIELSWAAMASCVDASRFSRRTIAM